MGYKVRKALLELFIFRIDKSRPIRRENPRARQDRKRLDALKHRRSIRTEKAKLDLLLNQWEGKSIQKRTLLESLKTSCRILNSLIREV